VRAECSARRASLAASALDAQNRDLSRRRGTERRTWHATLRVGGKELSPSVDAASSVARPADRDVPWDDEIRGDKPATPAEEAPDQRRGDRERRVGNHLVRPPGKPEICRVDLHHGDGRIRETLTEMPRATGVELDGDDARADVDQLARERAGTGPDVEHQITRFDPCRENEAASPAVSELMPSQVRPPFGGHGAPSPSSRQE
jgi:hypothetical protein